MKRQKAAAMAMIYIGGIALALGLSSCTSAASTDARTGVEKGAFSPCPGSPNCVSSMESAGPAAIAPFDYGSMSREQALSRLLALIEEDSNSTVVSREELEDGAIYVRAEYRSKLFRFVDDVEFLFPPASSLIHVKSASRVGYSDLGVNRNRVEELRMRFMRD